MGGNLRQLQAEVLYATERGITPFEGRTGGQRVVFFGIRQKRGGKNCGAEHKVLFPLREKSARSPKTTSSRGAGTSKKKKSC